VARDHTPRSRFAKISRSVCGRRTALRSRSSSARSCALSALVCATARAWPLREQHQRLCLMLKGLYAYFGISGNYVRLSGLWHQAKGCWRQWLSRRSNDGSLSWTRFQGVLALLPLPPPRIVHRYT
jgi:RNA-directed DNA polymerase